MSEPRYLNLGDAAMRLQGTIIRKGIEPIFVKEPVQDEGLKFVAYFLRNGEKEIIGANDNDLDISSVPMGFINGHDGCVHVSRTTARRQKQGFDWQHAQWKVPGMQNFPGGKMMLRKNPNDIVIELFKGRKGWVSVRQTILGEFPTFDDAFQKVKDTYSSMAFSRHFSVRGEKELPKVYFLNFRGDDIGVLGNNGFILTPTFQTDQFKTRLIKAGIPA